MDDLFPALPSDEAGFAGISDEQLTELLTQTKAAAKKLVDGDLPEGMLPADRVAGLEAGVANVKRIEAEQGERALAAEENEAKLAELAKELEDEPAAKEDDPDAEAEAEGDPENTPAGDETDPTAVAEREAALVASAAAQRATDAEAARKRRLPAPKGNRVPERDKAEGGYGVLTASADLPGFSAGQEIKTSDQLANALKARLQGISSMRGGADGQKFPVASIHTTLPDARTLRNQDGEIANMHKIESVLEPALTASGGLCAPVTPYYELMTVSIADRPVRDSLARFNADRGGIRFATPPKLSAFSGAIGRITAAQDAAGGTSAVKGCLTVTCPGFNEVDVAAIYRCIRFGNMGARAFPEQVAQANELVLAAFAQKAETALLDGIAAASTAVTTESLANGPGGMTSSLLSQLIVAAAAQRSRHRMDPDRTLRCMLPAWVLDALQVDVLRTAFMRFDNSDATFENQLRQANIEPVWYLDTPTAGGQVFGAQGAGAQIGFPSTVISFLFPEGSFLYLDSGVLDIGLVRDSTLNATNDYQIFAEGFENVAFIGVESLEITHNVCPSGEVTLAKAAPATCAV